MYCNLFFLHFIAANKCLLRASEIWYHPSIYTSIYGWMWLIMFCARLLDTIWILLFHIIPSHVFVTMTTYFIRRDSSPFRYVFTVYKSGILSYHWKKNLFRVHIAQEKKKMVEWYLLYFRRFYFSFFHHEEEKHIFHVKCYVELYFRIIIFLSIFIY